MSDTTYEADRPEEVSDPEPAAEEAAPVQEINEQEPKNDLRLNGIHLALGICDAVLTSVERDDL